MGIWAGFGLLVPTDHDDLGEPIGRPENRSASQQFSDVLKSIPVGCRALSPVYILAYQDPGEGGSLASFG